MTSQRDVIAQIQQLTDRCLREDTLTIGLLRYGAHLPHLYDASNPPRPREFDLLLSHMVDFMPRDFFAGRKVLVLDDTTYRGHEMQSMVNRLEKNYGVAPNAISTATVVVHKKSEFRPTHYIERYDDVDYIAWKETLARLVQKTQRPTDRDHPLYYFSVAGLNLAGLVTTLQDMGRTYAVGTDASGSTLRLVLPLPARVAEACADMIPAFKSLGEPKVRFYCRQKDDDHITFTALPLLFGEVDLHAFESSDQSAFCEMLGLRADYFRDLATSNVRDQDRMMYYFVNRALAAVILRHALRELVTRLPLAEVRCVPPAVRDGRVRYVFPASYVEFHDAMYRSFEEIVNRSARQALPSESQQQLFVSSCEEGRSQPFEEASDSAPQLLAFLSDRCHPAIFDGVSWEPAGTGQPTAYGDLLHEIGDTSVLSRLLDELLDCGLLRARDWAFDGGRRYTRGYLCGGEYKAVEVDRIRDSYRMGDLEIYGDEAAEERLALWGPDAFR